MKSVNQGSENMLNAALAACKTIADNETVKPISEKHPIDLILDDLKCRGGLSGTWEKIDANIQMEIRHKWTKFIDNEIMRFIDKRDSNG